MSSHVLVQYTTFIHNRNLSCCTTVLYTLRLTGIDVRCITTVEQEFNMSNWKQRVEDKRMSIANNEIQYVYINTSTYSETLHSTN